MRLRSVANNKCVINCKPHRSFSFSCARARTRIGQEFYAFYFHICHTYELKRWYSVCYRANKAVLTKLLLSRPLSFQCDSKVKAISSCCHLSLPMFTREVEGCDRCDSRKTKLVCVRAREASVRVKHRHKMPTRQWRKTAGSYLLYNELHYNGLMADLG